MSDIETEGRRIAEEARERVRFEEEALELSDQVYRVARGLVGSREEAEDLVQQTYERAFRSWQSFTRGTNLRAWLLRILTNLNIDRARRQQRRPRRSRWRRATTSSTTGWRSRPGPGRRPGRRAFVTR